MQHGLWQDYQENIGREFCGIMSDFAQRSECY